MELVICKKFDGRLRVVPNNSKKKKGFVRFPENLRKNNQLYLVDRLVWKNNHYVVEGNIRKVSGSGTNGNFHKSKKNTVVELGFNYWGDDQSFLEGVNRLGFKRDSWGAYEGEFFKASKDKVLKKLNALADVFGVYIYVW